MLCERGVISLCGRREEADDIYSQPVHEAQSLVSVAVMSPYRCVPSRCSEVSVDIVMIPLALSRKSRRL